MGRATSTPTSLGHWEKRNREAVEHYDPALLDRAQLVELFEEFGSDGFRDRLDQLDDGLTFLSLPDEDPATLDEFAACGITRAEDIRDVFTRQFHFGCEADDPINALAFDTARNPLGARLRALFASDIGHWDVPDVREVLPEAWELVEDGHVDRGRLPRPHLREPGLAVGRDEPGVLRRHHRRRRGARRAGARQRPGIASPP